MELPLSEDILAVSNNNGIWITLIILGVMILVVLAIVFIRKPSKIVSGYLKIGEKYVNIGDFIFPDNEENPSKYLLVEPNKKTLWEKQFLDKKRSKFVLKTEIEGIMYTFVRGSPGHEAPIKICAVMPIIDNESVIFQNDFSAFENVWNDFDSKELFVDEDHILFWSSSRSLKIKFVEDL